MRHVRLLVAVCAALMIAAPAMALDLEISGHYFVEAFSNSNITLNDNDKTDSYGSMEFMAKPVFKVNDNITLTTQFTALEDHVWGTDDNAQLNEDNPFAPDIDDGNNFDWKAAYMTIKTPIGGFVIGRYIDSAWGTGLGDSTASHGSNDQHKDRIMWIVPVGDFISGLVAQENQEGDKGNEFSNLDYYKFYGFSVYKQENWSAGLLISNYQHNDFVSQGDLRAFQRGFANYNTLAAAATTARGTYTGTYNQALELAGALNPALIPLVQGAPYDAATSAALDGALAGAGLPALDLFGLNSTAVNAEGAAAFQGAAISSGPARGKMDIWVIDPYFKGTFGPLSIETELLYGSGDIDLDVARVDPVTGQVFDSIDAEGFAATIDLKYDLAAFTFNAGYTYVQGDSDYTDDETNAIGYLEPSIDLEHGFLLTSDISGLEQTLGGTDGTGVPLGNLSGGPLTITGTAGYSMYWLGVKYAVLENLKLGLMFVDSKADDAPYVDQDSGTGDKWDDDHGEEYNFTVEWDIMDNLAFNGVIAHLSAGDFWQAGDPNADVEDNTTYYGRLTLEF